MQPKTQNFRTRLMFETKSIHSDRAYKILKHIMTYQLENEVDSFTPMYFYDGDPSYLVEIEDSKNYCLVKHLVSTPKEVEDIVRKSMLANEETFFELLHEMGLTGETFIFDAKNLAPITFDDFTIDTEKIVQHGNIFCTEKGVGIVKSSDTIYVFGTIAKTQALDLSIFSLYNRLPFIQKPKNSLTVSGCLLSSVVSGLFSGVDYEKIHDELNTELSNKEDLASYLNSKLGKTQITANYIDRMVGALKIDKLKEVLSGKDKEEIIDAEIVMKEGDTAFLSRIMEMGLNKFMTKLSGTIFSPVEVELDVSNIGAKRIFIREGAAFVVPENNDTYKDVSYWMSLLNSDNVALVQS